MDSSQITVMSMQDVVVGGPEKKKPKMVQQSVQGFEPIPKKSAIIKTDKPRPHICTTCTRGFARLEHLKRHERSHTNEKPFQCAACGRCFARRDLVLRHQQKLHSGMSTNSTLKDARKGDTDNIITNYGNKEVSLPMKRGSDDVSDARNGHKVADKGESSDKFGEEPHNHLKPRASSAFSDNSQRYARRRTIDDFDATSSLFQHSSTRMSVSSSNGGAHLEPSHKRQRHNSFSATSPHSYQKTVDLQLAHPGQHELPEAPHQVGFATPQLTAQELTSKALMSGIDLQALGLQYDIDDFSLDFKKEQNEDQSSDYFSINAKSDQPNHQGTKPCTPFQFSLTPGGSLMDVPILNEYLHTGSGGGGAGFTMRTSNNINLNMFAHKSNGPSPQLSNVEATSVGASGNEGSSVGHPTDTTSTSIHDDKMSPEDWLGEFINTPFDQNFSTNMKTFNSIGFVPSISPPSTHGSEHNISHHGSPMSHGSQPPVEKKVRKTNSHLFTSDISQMFRTRQVDLFKKVIENNEEIKQTSLPLFTAELRQQIMADNKLTESQFPSLDDLNQYTTQYRNEFDKYFPFIHLGSLHPSMENYPLILSIASIGALYSFHSGHALLLFNVARYRVHSHLEHQKSFNNNSNIPVWLYQSMVLLIFIGIFNNDLNVTKTMTIFLNSLIELVKLTSLNMPLETFFTPPPVIDNLQNSSIQTQEANFQYFILAQSRIRTCHIILLISNLFSSLVGLDYSLHSLDIKCGIHCKWDELWEAGDYVQWMAFLNKKHYVIDSKFALIELSNGTDSYTNCLNYLTLSNYILNDGDHSGKSIPMKTMLSLLMSIHEKIYLERIAMKNETNGILAATKWRMTSRPLIESLIKSWESLYIQNGGVFYLNETSLSVIYNKNPILRLILPLLSFAKIRKCVSLTPIIKKIWQKDWEGMNESLKDLRNDPEALKDSTNYALDIVKLWIDYVSIHNDAEKTSIRTPVFFITCIFTSLLIIAEFLLSVEKWAQNYDEEPTHLNAVERTLWLRSEMIFKKIEQCLMLDDNNKTYAEFLRLEAKGALDVAILDEEVAKRAVHPNTDITETRKVIQNARLSSRGLYLGVRILGDAPIWPIALLFAQALKARAIHISKSQPNTPL